MTMIVTGVPISAACIYLFIIYHFTQTVGRVGPKRKLSDFEKEPGHS